MRVERQSGGLWLSFETVCEAYKYSNLWGKFMHIMKIVTAVFAIALLAGPAAAGQTCPSGMSSCAAGSYGPGGCYKVGYATCTAGLVCTSGLTACAPGSYGPGGCYKMGYASCTAGLICSSGMNACAPGSKGPGGCYKPGYASCNQGQVTSR